MNSAVAADLLHLVQAIKLVEADPAIEQTVPDSIKGVDGSYHEGELPSKVQDVIHLACALLIDANGQSRSDLILTLRDRYSILVTCGERDSFGWLTGVIHTSKGTIVYG